MATTTNFGWETPDDTDLVKDGALAIRTLGSAIDTSLVDLKGGTTGQVLSKTSNTDMDFTWVTSDDANAIQNAIVDAKGDLITATAADTPARLAVGANGTVLTADSTEATGLKWAAASGGSTYVGASTYNTVNQTLSNSTTTAVTWDSEYFDTDALHSTSSNTSRFTVPTGKGGKYLISGTIAFDVSNVGNRATYIYKNGSLFQINNSGPGVSTNGVFLNFSQVLNLVAGDYIEIFAWQSSGGNLTIQGTTTFNTCQVSFLGA
jgi:hypothetical protein